MAPKTDAILRDLNPAQRAAVLHREGPLMVLAGAGSGKTRVITHRIAYLLATGSHPESILAITFTNKAAGEMKERAERLCALRSPWISTFHSFAARILRRHIWRLEPYDTSFTICDREDCLAIVKDLLKQEDIDPQLWEPRAVLGEISQLKNTREGDDSTLGSSYRYGQVLRTIYDLYTRHLQERNLLDFDDLLLLLVRLFVEHPDVLERYASQFEHVLVDEYQDTNAVQYRIGQLLAARRRNICVTGDPDQSIYSWRGADISNMLNFEHDFPDARVVRLEQNYRSTRNVLEVANALIAHNEQRLPKTLWTENPEGQPVRVHRFTDEQEEAREAARLVRRLAGDGTRLGDIAIFYRLNSLSRALEQELIYANLPYTIVGGLEFFLRKEIKDLLAFLRILDNPRDSGSLLRVLNVPPRGIGKGTMEALVAAARAGRRGLLEVVLHRELRSALPPRQAAAVDRFRALYEGLAAVKGESVEAVLRAVVERTGYEEYIERGHGEEAAERLENVGELLGAAVEYDRNHPRGTLTGFLELAAILGDVDRWERQEDRVSLMTLHAAKGLEFPVVVIAGVEDGILPLLRASDPEPDLEEERRLLYVGITRARELLYLTHTACRKRYGRAQPAFPSRFLREIQPAGEEATGAFQRLEMDLATEESLHGGPRRSAWRWRREALTENGGDVDADFAGEGAEDLGFEPDEDPYPAGARVLHDEYGLGRVLDSSGFGSRRRVRVLFEEHGEKQFVAAYTPLRRLS